MQQNHEVNLISSCLQTERSQETPFIKLLHRHIFVLISLLVVSWFTAFVSWRAAAMWSGERLREQLPHWAFLVGGLRF